MHVHTCGYNIHACPHMDAFQGFIQDFPLRGETGGRAGWAAIVEWRDLRKGYRFNKLEGQTILDLGREVCLNYHRPQECRVKLGGKVA